MKEKTDPSDARDSDFLIVEEEEGRYYDRRLGHLTDAMYGFATLSHMALEPRYSAWYFLWKDREIQRSIQLNVLDETYPYRIEVIPSAWIDDLKQGYRFYLPARQRQTLELPVSRRDLLRLLAESKREAELITRQDLSKRIELSEWRIQHGI
jgi:hypothetical protein